MNELTRPAAPPLSEPTTPPRKVRQARDRAMILPIVGLALLLPPFATIFAIDLKIAGIPLTVLYLFTVWAALIAGAALLARPLSQAESSDGNSESPTGTPG